MLNEKENSGKKVNPEKAAERIVTAHEKAQFEVFTNGAIPKERIKEMIDNDLKAIMSFANGMLRDPELNAHVVDVYHRRYMALHENAKENGAVQDKS